MTTVFTSPNGQITIPRQVIAGALIQVTPGLGATVTLEFTLQDMAAIINRVAVWQAWPKGPITTPMQDMVGETMHIRLTSIGGADSTCTIEPRPSVAMLQAYKSAFGGGAQFTSTAAGPVISSPEGPGSPLSSPANTMAVTGDSITAQWLFASASETQGKGYFAWMRALSGQRFNLLGSFAVGGSGATPYATAGVIFGTQVKQAIDTLAEWLWVGPMVVNDTVNGAPLPDITTAVLVGINRARAAGMKIFLCTAPCISSTGSTYSVLRNGQILRYNSWVRELCKKSSGIILVDLASAFINPTGTTNDYIPGGTLGDGLGLHPNNLAGYYGGKLGAQVVMANMPALPQLISSNADTQAYSPQSRNKLSNPLFVNGANTATGYTTSVVGGATVTPTLVARADGFGNDQQLVITYAASGDAGRLTTGDMKAGIVDGDTIVFMCEINTSAMTNTRAIRVNLAVNGTLSSKLSTEFQLDAANDVALPEGFTATYMTLPIKYDAATMGTLTVVQATITAFGSGAGGVTMKVGRASCPTLILS